MSRGRMTVTQLPGTNLYSIKYDDGKHEPYTTTHDMESLKALINRRHANPPPWWQWRKRRHFRFFEIILTRVYIMITGYCPCCDEPRTIT